MANIEIAGAHILLSLHRSLPIRIVFQYTHMYNKYKYIIGVGLKLLFSLNLGKAWKSDFPLPDIFLQHFAVAIHNTWFLGNLYQIMYLTSFN